MKDKQAKPEKEILELSAEELQLISKVLYNSAWTGEQWQKNISPLLSKLRQIVLTRENTITDKIIGD